MEKCKVKLWRAHPQTQHKNKNKLNKSLTMTCQRPKKIGITERDWEEAVKGFKEDTNETFTYFDEANDIQKTITLAGPNVLGAMCGYCCAGPM